ncbi:MAG: aldo/keto reductase [Phycisphaerales bacterium]|nr:MAG: aldo/keto reductase [Phycisphaerales bacterium]
MIEFTRREFLAAASAATIAGGLGRGGPATGQSVPAVDGSPAAGALPMVEVGTTGRVVPRLGLGTAPAGWLDTDEEAVPVLQHALDKGIRYLDTAPSYSRGRAEARLGLALQGRRREDFFIATKTLERRGDEARRDVEQSLQRLKTDHVELVQVHAVSTDVDSLFGPEAVLKTLEKMREEKIIGGIGVTVHQNPKYAIEAVTRYPFVTALVPINVWDTKQESFIREFLPVAKERNVAVIAMKVFAVGKLLEGGRLTAGECLQYAFSQDHVAVAVPGCEAISHVDEAYEAAVGFKPLSAEAQEEVINKAGEHKGKESEWYRRPVAD